MGLVKSGTAEKIERSNLLINIALLYKLRQRRAPMAKKIERSNILINIALLY